MALVRKIFRFILLLSIASPITAETKVKKGPDLSPGGDQQQKDELSMESIMSGNQQNKPASNASGALAAMLGKGQNSSSDSNTETTKTDVTQDPLKSTDHVKGDLGSSSAESHKSDYADYPDSNTHSGGESYVIFSPGTDDEDYQYEEPYALYRKRRDLSQQENTNINFHEKEESDDGYPERANRAKRSAGDIFGENEDDSNDNQLPEFYQYLEEKNPAPPYGKILREEILPGLAKEIYPQLLGGEKIPERVIGINKDDTYNTRYGSTMPLPLWNKGTQPVESQYYNDGANWKGVDKKAAAMLDMENDDDDDAERLYELAMLLQAAYEKEHK